MPHQRLARRKPDAARLVAYRTLRAVSGRDAFANIELGQQIAAARLDARDAAFATELVAGTARLAGTYDRVVAAASGRAPGQIKPDVADVLRLGVHQLLSMRVPARAAVAATVELAGAEIGEKVVGLVNFVLRRVAERDLDAWVAKLSGGLDALDALALRTHHPRWIAETYAHLLGDEAEAALVANNDSPVTSLVVRPGLADVAELGGEPLRYSPFGVRRAGSPADVAAVRAGRAGVQDEGSQLVAWALARAEAPAGPWLDLCAGPGGKAALLAGLARGRGERLTASEVAPHRAQLVRQALRAYPDAPGAPAPEVLCCDGTAPAWPLATFARVMADVPCTGLGALRRRPEARWRRQESSLAELVGLQRALLSSAIASTMPGGVVAYVTCSPHPAETVDVVDAVLATTPAVSRLDTAAFLTGVPDCAQGTAVQLWPHRHGTDAMFCQLLRVGA